MSKESQCLNKKRRTKAEAFEWAISHAAEGMQAYSCRFCEFWHCGHHYNPKLNKEFLNSIEEQL